MLRICTAWKQAVDGDPREFSKGYKVELVNALVDEKVVSEDQLRRGLRRLRQEGSDFLPNPGKFASWCGQQLSDFGLPDPREAYEEASREFGKHSLARRWSHPAVYAAASQVGTSYIKSEIEAKAFPRFERTYVEVCHRVMAGEQLQLPEEVRLEKKPERPAPKAVAKKHLSGLKSLFEVNHE